MAFMGPQAVTVGRNHGNALQRILVVSISQRARD